MSQYSVATTKDKLSSLIDLALSGEEVIVTRHGKPAVALVRAQPASAADVRIATIALQRRLGGTKPLAIPTERFSDWLYEDDSG